MNNLRINICKDISVLLKSDLDLILENTSIQLFDFPFNISAEELLYIYFYLKRKYKFKKDNELILNGGFSSIDNILKMIS